jgi:hypothetical protein
MVGSGTNSGNAKAGHGVRSGFYAIPENAENAIQWVQIGPSALEAVVGSASMPATGPTLSGLHPFVKTGIGWLLFGYLFANGRSKETVGPGRPSFAIQISRHCAWIQIITADSRLTLTLTKNQTDRAGQASMRGWPGLTLSLVVQHKANHTKPGSF